MTGLVTAAELLPPGRPTELVRDRAQAMRTLVEDVLEVARLDGASEQAELQEIALGEFVRRRVPALAPGRRGTRGARVRWSRPTRAGWSGSWATCWPTPPGTAPPPIEVTVEGRVVRVRDHGPGFPADLLREGPSRFRTGSTDRAGSGHGLGLTIAAGQARVLGARLTFRNTPGEDGGGAVAQLLLPR